MRFTVTRKWPIHITPTISQNRSCSKHELNTAISRKVVQLKSIKAYATIPKDMKGCGCSLLHRQFTSFQRVGRRCYEYLFACVKRNKMDSELLTCLLKFIEYFPDYISALSRTLLLFFWTTFVETAVYVGKPQSFISRTPRFAVCEIFSQSGTHLYGYTLNSNTS